MLNPESVDYISQKQSEYPDGHIKIIFTENHNGDEALCLNLRVNDAFKLGKMLNEQTNMKAKNRRIGGFK